MRPFRRFRTTAMMSLFAGSVLLAAISCGDDNDEPTPKPEAVTKFFIAATQDGATYFVTADSLTSGTVGIAGTGIEVSNSFSHLVNGTNNAITALAYRQGDPGVGISFKLDDNGNLTKLSNEFSLNDGYNTCGVFENYIVAGRNATLASTGATGANFYFVDQSSGTVTEKEFDSRVLYPTDSFTTTITAPVFAGIVDRGNGEWLSAYTKETANVDSVWVAAFDKDFKLKRVYTDNRLSYSAGRFRSARYAQIANDDKGNTYVFSGSYESTSIKPAGVIRINKDATTFDASYYWDIQAASGDYKFRKVWHAGGDNFLLEVYNNTGNISNASTATRYAIVNVVTKSFNWVRTGFPAADEITATGWPLPYNGKVYIPVVSTANEYPVVYAIDPATGAAQAGVVIQAAGVLGLGVLQKQ
ncbi:MAG: DUF4374 domain-containing protein [Dysgonamonadaceae bacterium]|jgi:hypothetical protein|nr:DUF4374 domain-containing protein [Dysgonamonadaceae bacterium]